MRTPFHCRLTWCLHRSSKHPSMGCNQLKTMRSLHWNVNPHPPTRPNERFIKAMETRVQDYIPFTMNDAPSHLLWKINKEKCTAIPSSNRDKYRFFLSNFEIFVRKTILLSNLRATRDFQKLRKRSSNIIIFELLLMTDQRRRMYGYYLINTH